MCPTRDANINVRRQKIPKLLSMTNFYDPPNTKHSAVTLARVAETTRKRASGGREQAKVISLDKLLWLHRTALACQAPEREVFRSTVARSARPAPFDSHVCQPRAVSRSTELSNAATENKTKRMLAGFLSDRAHNGAAQSALVACVCMHNVRMPLRDREKLWIYKRVANELCVHG